MNISKLTLIQQIALAAKFSSLEILTTQVSGPFMVNNFSRSPGSKNNEDKLTASIFRKLKGIQVRIPDLDNDTLPVNSFMNQSNRLSFSANSDGSVQVSVNETLPLTDVLDAIGNAPEVRFDRFGIHGSIVISKDLKESLEKILTVFGCLTHLSDTYSTYLIKVVEHLLTGLSNIEKSSENINDLFPVSASNVNVFDTMVESICFKDWEYDDNTGQTINLPSLIIERDTPNGFVASYTYANVVSNLNRLHVKYTESDEENIAAGKLEISVSFNKSEKRVLSTTDVAIGLNTVDFMQIVTERITDAIETLTNKERFVEMGNFVNSTINDAKDFIKSVE